MAVKVCLFSSTIGAYEGWLTLPEAPRKGQFISVVRHADTSHWEPPGEYTYLITHEMGWKPYKGKYVYCVVGQEQNNNEVIQLRDQYRRDDFNPFSKRMCLNPTVGDKGSVHD